MDDTDPQTSTKSQLNLPIIPSISSHNSDDDSTTRLTTTINDLPDEIILNIMNNVFQILGPKMYIFDFPTPAAVCQKWFMIYFEMYWQKWGFLSCKRATMEDWLRLARVRNGVSLESSAKEPPMSLKHENLVTLVSRPATVSHMQSTKSKDHKKAESTGSFTILRMSKIVETKPGDSLTTGAVDEVHADRLDLHDEWTTVARRSKKSLPLSDGAGVKPADTKTKPKVKPKRKLLQIWSSAPVKQKADKAPQKQLAKDHPRSSSDAMMAAQAVCKSIWK